MTLKNFWFHYLCIHNLYYSYKMWQMAEAFFCLVLVYVYVLNNCDTKLLLFLGFSLSWFNLMGVFLSLLLGILVLILVPSYFAYYKLCICRINYSEVLIVAGWQKSRRFWVCNFSAEAERAAQIAVQGNAFLTLNIPVSDPLNKIYSDDQIFWSLMWLIKLYPCVWVINDDQSFCK